MPVAKARALALDIAALVGAIIVWAAYLSKPGPQYDAKAFAYSLLVAAALIRLYWRLADKLDG